MIAFLRAPRAARTAQPQRRSFRARGTALVTTLLLLAGTVLPLLPPRTATAAGCETAGPQPDEQRLSAEQRALLALARRLPLEVKAGQLLMPGFVGTVPDVGLLDRARRGHVGGFFFLIRNVQSAPQIRALTSQLDRAAAEGSGGIRPFLATDFEGGTVNTLSPIIGATTSAAQMTALGAAGVEARGAHDAGTLKAYGFNVDLAPVADVLSAPSSVIGTRAFSSDPATTATVSRAYLRGLQGGGVLGVMKHFPGHGSTADDSHVLLPTVSRNLAQLEAADLLPYRQAIAAGELRALMIGHLLVPALDPELPSTLSRPIITGLARERLGFDGLIMTDELKMAAISQRYSAGTAAVMAIQAGVDVILADYTGAEQDAVLQALVRACQGGQLAPGRLEQSVARVLRLKLAYGLAGPDMEAAYAALLRSGGAVAAPAPAAALAAVVPDLGGVALRNLPDGAGGRFYSEAVGKGDFGYAITDEGGVGLWGSYAGLGGPAQLGYPISQRFLVAGMMAQLTQRALLQWDPERQTAAPANAFELFERAGTFLGWPGCGNPPPERAAACSLDPWLLQKGIPGPIEDDGSGGDYRRAVATRLSWLENDPIRAFYLADPAGGPAAPWPGDEALAAGLEGTPDTRVPTAAIQRYGLPMSRPVRFGPFLTQRFQRVALQLWLDDVPGMPAAGTVTPVLAGELLREAGFAPTDALVPATVDGAPGVAPDLPPPPGPPAPPAAETPAPTPDAATEIPVAPTATAVSTQPTPMVPPAPTAPPATATRAPGPSATPAATAARTATATTAPAR